VRADFRSAFPHASHSPVAGFAAGLDNLRIDTGTVVTNSQTQVRGVVCNLNFYAFCSRVVERVYQCLVSNPIGFVSDEWVKLARVSLYDNAEFNALTDSKVLDDVSESFS
jgi:predicted transglutaminase-like cysteine proteinase